MMSPKPSLRTVIRTVELVVLTYSDPLRGYMTVRVV